MTTLLDTGPLVALLDSTEPDHPAVHDFIRANGRVRFLTTGAVITEAFYFLAEIPHGPANLVTFLEAADVQIRDAFNSDTLSAAVRLMEKYSDTPMDFPDATLVWLAGEAGVADILTLDRRGFGAFRFARNNRFRLLLDEQ